MQRTGQDALRAATTQYARFRHAWGFHNVALDGNLGKRELPKEKEIFQSFFGPDSNNQSSIKIHGLALGTSADISTQLLGHLQNGMLPETLRPRLWIVLIGTNNLGVVGCTRHMALAGILSVVRYLRLQRPNTPISIHGLLPRGDSRPLPRLEPNATSYSLGIFWKQIEWINARLQHFVKIRGKEENLFYMEASHIFLREISAGVQDSNKTAFSDRYQVDNARMKDALHPSPAGYLAWASLLDESAKKVLKAMRK